MEMSRPAPSILDESGGKLIWGPPRTETILKLREYYLHPPFFKRIGWGQTGFSWWQVPSDKSLMKQILESFDHQTASYSCLSHLWKERLSWILQLKPRSKTTFPRSKSPDRTIPFQVGFFWRFRGYHSWWCHPDCKKLCSKWKNSFPNFFGYQKMTPQKMWSHHRLVPFDLLVKKPPFAFFALPSKSIQNILLGTNSLTYPLF